MMLEPNARCPDGPSAPAFCRNMPFSENRFGLFQIIVLDANVDAAAEAGAGVNLQGGARLEIRVRDHELRRRGL
jgi:hypothetical protein